ncbi:ABC transporter [Catenovulum agarivorans DS-2]|uniref:ABC transporter n=1 Tax=Catenovulum agarivorans DS-2 TaxID=1328313 RepID=W7QL37_9ALTE|nr:Gldg family protein [Catenovulum agarivorans]EWH09637.1 ABC transporter [Catenovulum agarivorans DS-2]
MKKMSLSVGLTAILVLFVAVTLLNNSYLNPYRLDLTENKVYSLSQGSKNILDKIDEPVHLYFFFSDKTSEGLTQIRSYAERVKNLLEEYELYSKGKLKLHIIDPEPFSEEEDKAAEFGLTAAPVGGLGENLYFGLGGRNALDAQEIIAFFDPNKEEFLEYDISKLLQNLIEPNSIKVSIITDLPIAGEPQQPMNPMMMQQQRPQPWVFFEQLRQMYEVEMVASDAESLPADTDVLMLINPAELSDELAYSIDQYIINDGSVLAFVDPHAEQQMNPMMAANSSNIALSEFLAAWGLEFESDNIVLDSMSALEIRMPSGGVGKHLAYLGLPNQMINKSDPVTSQLESINGASFGVLSAKEDASASIEVLLSSSENAGLTSSAVYSTLSDPKTLFNHYQSTGEQYQLALRVTGEVNSRFKDDESKQQNGYKSRSTQANIIVIADTDLLADRFWVQKSNFFGQTVASAFANNGDLVANAVENLGGSNDLISIRARGKFTRPFIKVKEIEVAAEAKFRTQEQQLQARLQETESQLAQLQNQQGEGGALVITPEQEAAINNFIQEKLSIRKALRNVQHQLNQDIERLGTQLKFANIIVAPLLLTFLLWLFSLAFKRKKLA